MDRKSNFPIFLFCLVLPVFFLLPAFPSLCLAKTVTLGWDANPEPDLEGYVIYRNAESPGPPYKYADELPEDELKNPLNPQVKITGLQKDTRYYIAVTAYDTQGNESYFSDQLCLEIVDSLVENCGVILNAPSSSSESSGGSGSGNNREACFINSTSGTSGQRWVLAGIVIIMLLFVSRLLSAAKTKQLTTNNEPQKGLFLIWTKTRPPRGI